MSSAYELLGGLELHEHGCKFDLELCDKVDSPSVIRLRGVMDKVPMAYSPGDEVCIPIVEDLDHESLLRLIVKLIHIASYFDGKDQDTLERFNVTYNQTT